MVADFTASAVGVTECVFLTCFDHDASFFASLLSRSGIRLHRADTLEMADLLLTVTSGTVFLLETNFLDGSWEDALDMAAACHPTVPALLCADTIDRSRIAGASERGVFEVLWRPLDLQVLRSAIHTAHEAAVERRLWRTARSAFRSPIAQVRLNEPVAD